MNSASTTLILLLSSPVLLFFVHMILARINHRLPPQIVTLAAIIFTYPPMAFLLWYFVLHNASAKTADYFDTVIYSFVVYSAIAYSYFHLFNLSETGRRIRIFYEIYKADSLPPGKTTSTYDASDILNLRLQRLVATGQLEHKNGLYFRAGSFLYYAAVAMEALRSLLAFEDRKQQPITPELAQRIYWALVRSRKFDEKVVELYPQQEMRCPTHLSIGQEGIAAGVCAALKKEDIIFSSHRCHSHSISKGADLKLIMAELYGKKTGCSKGKGGSMHFFQPEIGMMGSSAIVAGTIPIAVGAAMAAKMKGEKIVSVAFFGDAAVEQGAFHESMNFASLKKLPIIFICENNFLSTCTFLSERQPSDDIYKRSQSYLIPGFQVDGTNAVEVYLAAKTAVDRARNGEGPSFIEARCYRWREHVGPNFDCHPEFRSKEEVEKAMENCPVKNFESYAIQNQILSKESLQSIVEEVEKEVKESVVFSQKSNFPELEEIYTDV